MFQKWVDVHHRPMGFETGTPENARVFSKTNQKILKKITHDRMTNVKVFWSGEIACM